MRNIKWPRWYFVFSVVFVMAFFIYHYENPSELKNEKFMHDLLLSFEGQLIEKYIDKENHEYKTCRIRESNDTLTVLLNFDQSGLFEYLNTGDSVSKVRGDSTVTVRRGNHIKYFYLRY